jgi:hypothetical protein
VPAVQWNGINEIVRQRHPEQVVQVRHETWTRSDALLAATGVVPAELQENAPPLAPYSAESQFSRRVFTTASDVVVLSLQPDIITPLVQHRSDDYLLYPYDWNSWPAEMQQWLVARFRDIGHLDVASSVRNLTQLCTEIQGSTGAHVLIYNVSATVPGDLVHCHQGFEDVLATRIRRFNLGLIELSQQLGVSIVDVDALLAGAGAARLKIGPFHLTAEGCRLVAQEVVRILEDLGCFG